MNTGGNRLDFAMARITRPYANMNPNAVANVAGMLKMVATSEEILNISINPLFSGFKSIARYTDPLESSIAEEVVRDAVTKRTPMLVKNSVRTQAIDDRPIVFFGCNLMTNESQDREKSQKYI